MINLDALDEEARLRLFEDAARTRVIPCVSVSTAIDASAISGSQKCAQSFAPMARPANTRPTTGLPVMPDNLKTARERIRDSRPEGADENQREPKSSSLLRRLKFW